MSDGYACVSILDKPMTRLDIIASAADEFSRLVAALLSVGSLSPPNWNKDFGWRHPEGIRDVVLFWLTKLAGMASTIHASVSLAKQGYWFQVAILSRSVTESHLSIAYTFPKPDMKSGEWPNGKQSEAIREHYKETWTDPKRPFEDQRQRPNIRNISAAIGHMQSGNSALTPHDASQSSVQTMRYLSDYTHMAYPQIMELFSDAGGFLLAGKQANKPLLGEMELGRLIVGSFIDAESVSEVLRKCYLGCAEKAEAEQAEKKKVALIKSKLQSITALRDEFEAIGTKLETAFPSSDDEARRILRAFKEGKPL